MGSVGNRVIGITKIEVDIFNSIRNKTKEHLIMYDNLGNILHTEVGTHSHTGYEQHEYAGMNVVHNHPKGVAYYPSNTDLVTFHNSGANSMTVVSPEHTIKIIRTDAVDKNNYVLSSPERIDNLSVPNISKPFGNLSAQQYRQKYNVTVRDTNKLKADYELQRRKKIMEDAGYKVIIT